jgi:hypothetical protein
MISRLVHIPKQRICLEITGLSWNFIWQSKRDCSAKVWRTWPVILIWQRLRIPISEVHIRQHNDPLHNKDCQYRFVQKTHEQNGLFEVFRVAVRRNRSDKHKMEESSLFQHQLGLVWDFISQQTGWRTRGALSFDGINDKIVPSLWHQRFL